MDSGRCRKIRREASSVQWLWTGRPGHVHAFDAPSNRRLERAYQAWQCSDSFCDSSVQLELVEQLYEVHFPSMTQKNLSSGRKRQVLRHFINVTDSANQPLGCLVCGCGREWDEWGERICWCDSCWFTNCTYKSNVSSTCVEVCQHVACLNKLEVLQPNSRKRTNSICTTLEETTSSSSNAWEQRDSSLEEQASASFTQYTLKISLGDDRRRLPIKWANGASPEEVYAAIQSAVCTAFRWLLPKSAGFALKYKDDDGDLCTLCPDTLKDCLSFACDGVIRIVPEEKGLMTNVHVAIGSPRRMSKIDMQRQSIDDAICEEYSMDWDFVESPAVMKSG